jgi:hypothetical protein
MTEEFGCIKTFRTAAVLAVTNTEVQLLGFENFHVSGLSLAGGVDLTDLPPVSSLQQTQSLPRFIFLPPAPLHDRKVGAMPQSYHTSFFN